MNWSIDQLCSECWNNTVCPETICKREGFHRFCSVLELRYGIPIPHHSISKTAWPWRSTSADFCRHPTSPLIFGCEISQRKAVLGLAHYKPRQHRCMWWFASDMGSSVHDTVLDNGNNKAVIKALSDAGLSGLSLTQLSCLLMRILWLQEREKNTARMPISVIGCHQEDFDAVLHSGARKPVTLNI